MGAGALAAAEGEAVVVVAPDKNKRRHVDYASSAAGNDEADAAGTAPGTAGVAGNGGTADVGGALYSREGDASGSASPPEAHGIVRFRRPMTWNDG